MIQTIDALSGLMRQHGAVSIYAKKLAPNDNSKNQIYLGGDFSALNIIPHGDIITDGSELAGSVRDRAKAGIRFRWVNESGLHAAPNAQLVLYPKYPEVRMSGFLKGCLDAPSEIMRSRDEGRVLFIGITRNGLILGYAAAAGSMLAQAIYALPHIDLTGVFIRVPDVQQTGSTRDRLIAALSSIYDKHWIQSQKLGNDGIAHPYAARNGGGYTLEAELGITPNGYAEPDYLGWEIKQYGVNDFDRFRPKSPVTLLTPEPTGGYYRDEGVEAFVRQFGYTDKSGKKDRLNFGGIYACNKTFHAGTGLRLCMIGYDSATGKITDLDGGIALQDRNDRIAALWKFTGIIQHWNRKHAKAAYVPSLFRTPPPQYRYGPRIQLCEQTDLSLFLAAVASGAVYYDPAIKLEKSESRAPAIKRRSQFRVKHANLEQLYHHTATVELGV